MQAVLDAQRAQVDAMQARIYAGMNNIPQVQIRRGRGHGHAQVHNRHANQFPQMPPALPPQNFNQAGAAQQAQHEHVMAIIAQQRAHIEAMNAANRR
jgi:hypothetical protein